MDVILQDVEEEEAEAEEFSTSTPGVEQRSDDTKSKDALNSPDGTLDDQVRGQSPVNPEEKTPERTPGKRDFTKLDRDNSGIVDDLSMDTESIGSGSSGIRRSSLLESLVLKQMRDPVCARPLIDPNAEATHNDGVRSTTSDAMYGNTDRDMDQGRNRARNRDSGRDLDQELDSYSRYPDPSRGRNMDRDSQGSPVHGREDHCGQIYGRDGRGSPVHGRDGQGSPVHGRDGRGSSVHGRDGKGSPIHGKDGQGSPVRGIRDRDRSASPIRSYHREPLESGQSSSPTRSSSFHRDPLDDHHQPASPTRGPHGELDFQPIRSSGVNGGEPSDWVARNGTGGGVGCGPQSGRQSTSSEQEMSKYFGNNDSSHGRHLRSTPDPNATEKLASGDRLELSLGRRSVERLSEIMRRSSDRLADLDRDVTDTPGRQATPGYANPDYDRDRENKTRSLSWDRDRELSRDRDRDRDQPHSRDMSFDRSSSGYHQDLDPYAHDSEPYMTSSHDKRNLCSDVSNSMSQPPLRPALVTSRTTPLSASRTASRPQIGSSGKTPGGKDDLEDTVSSLRRVLKEREREVDELKSQQRTIQAELHQLKNAEAIFDKGQNREEKDKFQKKVDGLIADRENLTTEVWRLKQELDRCMERNPCPGPRSSSPGPEELDSYDPNNPRALRRKIKDLEGQVQDLQEANETASAKLSRTERLMQDAQEESQLLRLNQDGASRDLREENALLKEQLESLRTEPSESSVRAGGDGDGEYLQWEVRQLRTDLHHLRDRNHQLTQDNIKLTDYIRDLEARAALNRTTNSEIKKSAPHRPAGNGSSDYRHISPTRDTHPHTVMNCVDSDLYDRVDRYRKEREDDEVQQQQQHQQQQQQQQLVQHPQMGPGYRSLSPTRHTSELRSFPPLTHATRNSDDLRFSNDIRKDTYSRTHSGGAKESRSQPLHATTTNGFDYDDRPGRHCEKSDSAMYLTTTPSSGLREHHDARPSAARELDFTHVPQHGLLADIKNLPPPTKVDMVDDLIDEPPASSRVALQSAMPSTYTPSSTSSTRQHSGGVGSLYPATSSAAPPAVSTDRHSLRPKPPDHDTSISSSRIQASIEDFDEDEFFLGPGNRTYKVSSSTGGKYTEPFVSHINKTYDDLSSNNYSALGNSGQGKKQPQEVVVPLHVGGLGVVGSNHESLSGALKDRPTSDNPYMNGLKDPMSTKDPISIKDPITIQKEISALDSDDSDGLDLKGHLGSLGNGHHSELIGGPHGLQSGHQVGGRRDSVSSDSTDYILSQAEQHLKHGCSVLDAPLPVTSVRGVHSDPPPPPPPSNKHFSGGSSSFNPLPVPRSASPLHPAAVATSGGSGPQARPVSVTPSSRGTLPFSAETLSHSSGSPMPSSSSLGTLTSQSRTLSPAFTVSAHKSQYGPSSSNRPDSSFAVSGKRPFAPRTVMDVKMEDVVKFTRQGGKISKGVIKYIGHLPGKNDTYLGIELEHEMGKHDGLYDGQRYFTCQPNRGVFVAFSRVVMAWSGPE